MYAAPTIIEVPTVVQPAPVVVQPAPVVVQQAPATVIQQAAPAVIQQTPPAVIQQAPPVVAPIAPVHPSASNLSPQEINALRGLLQKSSYGTIVKSAPIPTAKQEPASTATRVTVLLPGTARLWVDNVECPLSSSVRSFNTPPLNANQQYFYNMKVELAHEGKMISETQRVLITPGQEVRVDFNNVGAIRTVAR